MTLNSNNIDIKNQALSFLGDNGIDIEKLNKILSDSDILDMAIMLGFNIKNVDISNNQETSDDRIPVIRHGINRKPDAKYKYYIPQELRDYVNRQIKLACEEDAKALKYAYRYIAR